MSLFDDFDLLAKEASHALATMSRIKNRNDISIHARRGVLLMMVLAINELNQELEPVGMAEKLLRDLQAKGAPKK